MVQSSSNPPLLIRDRKRLLNLAVRNHGRGPHFNTPVIIRIARDNKLPEAGGCSFNLNRFDRAATYRPTEWIISTRGQYLQHLSKRFHLRLRPSLPKSTTRQETGTQGESRSIRGIEVPPHKLADQHSACSRDSSPSFETPLHHSCG